MSLRHPKLLALSSLLVVLGACHRENPAEPGETGLGIRALMSSTGALAYVANQGSNSVSVIETATNTVTATVPVGDLPSAVAVTPNGAFVYVVNVVSNDVSVIESSTNAVIATVPVGSAPRGLAITPDGAFAYVANESSDDVSVIATATNTVTTTVPVGFGPVDAAITPDGAFAYVVNQGAGGSVSVIATATNTVTTTFPVVCGPSGAAITPDGAFVYVANICSNNVAVIATATNSVIATVPVGNNPRGLAMTPDGAFVYVANINSNSVSVIATATNTVTATVPVANAPVDVAVTQDGAFAYATNAGSATVSVIATASNTVTATVSVGNGPSGVAIGPAPTENPTLSSLGPALLWIGLKNSDAIGLRVDLRAEVLVDGNIVGSGESFNLAAGSSGFQNAVLRTVSLTLSEEVEVPDGAQLEFKVSARRTCFGGGHNSGTLRFWYNGQPVDAGPSRDAGSRFEATIGEATDQVFIRSNFELQFSAGVSRQFADAVVNSAIPCPSRPYTSFGSWTRILP